MFCTFCRHLLHGGSPAMMVALVAGCRVTARPGRRAECPGCGGEVIPKCGQINAWHWAHRRADCDPWSEPMTQWHADWQSRFPGEMCEAVLGAHRADVRLPSGFVIEFQHSALSVADIRERERHYGRMAWVWDATAACGEARLSLRRRDGYRQNRYRSFRWRHARRSILACRCRVFLDIGEGWLLDVRRIYPRPFAGWGYLMSVDEFVTCALRECEFEQVTARV